MLKESVSIEPCPRCGGAIPAGAPEGLCPKCLLSAAAVPTEDGAESARLKPPGLEVLQAAFPQFEILELIGHGGMGLVYKARQPKLNRVVALKLLPRSHGEGKAFADRFAREAQALAALNHPNIVTVHDYGESGEFFYLLMEFVDGVNLRQALQAGGISPEQALAIVPQICEALQFAHDRGIVHRDIKPENLLLNKEGRLKIADFGIATLLDQQNAVDGTPAGTPRYAAPEQMTDPLRADHRADIYSLGVVFYELLTGQMPPQPIEPPSRKVQIDVRLDEVVLRALEKSPNFRWQTAAEMGTRVETIASERNPGAGRGMSRRPGRPPTHWRGVLAMCAPPALFEWFVLAGHRHFRVDLDADMAAWLALLGFPTATGVGVGIAWVLGAFPSRFETWKEGRWGAIPVVSLLLLAASIGLMGLGMFVASLIANEESWNPNQRELIFTLVFLGIGPLTGLAATIAGWTTLRRIREGSGLNRGARAGWIAAWFWPGVLCLMLGLHLLSALVPGTPSQARVRERVIEQQQQAMQEILLQARPPVVIATDPPSGAYDVTAGEREVRVTFSKPMAEGSWSWVEAWPGSTSEIVAEPYFEGDRSCVMRVKMEPGRTYAWWINSDTFQNFRDRNGTPAVPYLLIFETQPAPRNGVARPE